MEVKSKSKVKRLVIIEHNTKYSTFDVGSPKNEGQTKDNETKEGDNIKHSSGESEDLIK